MDRISKLALHLHPTIASSAQVATEVLEPEDQFQTKNPFIQRPDKPVVAYFLLVLMITPHLSSMCASLLCLVGTSCLHCRITHPKRESTISPTTFLAH